MLTTIERLAELGRHSVLLFLDRNPLQNRAPLICVRKQKLRAGGWDVKYNRQPSRRLWTIQRILRFASSQKFASQTSPDIEPSGVSKSMQIDANTYETIFNDTNDGHDANSGKHQKGDTSLGNVLNNIPF